MNMLQRGIMSIYLPPDYMLPETSLISSKQADQWVWLVKIASNLSTLSRCFWWSQKRISQLWKNLCLFTSAFAELSSR